MGFATLHPDTDPESVGPVTAEMQRQTGRVALSIRAEERLPQELLSAATAAISGVSNTTLYVLGYGKNMNSENLIAFAGVQNLNLNVRQLSDYGSLAEFSGLESLTIQSSATRAISMKLLSVLSTLKRLNVPANITDVDVLAECSQLEYLGCTSNRALLAALPENPRLAFLSIHFGSNRDLRSIAAMPALRGLGIYQVRGLDGDDLDPIAEAVNLQALSLGALKNVTHLGALRGAPRDSLTAVLLEGVRSLANLADIRSLRALRKLGLYESRPQDQDLTALRNLTGLTELIIGDVYPKSQIDALLGWYSGALGYRNKINRGEPGPRWRSPIDRLA